MFKSILVKLISTLIFISLLSSCTTTSSSIISKDGKEINQLKTIPINYKSTGGYLGVRTSFKKELNGISVDKIFPETPAAMSDLYVDDIVKSINGFKLDSDKLFSYLLSGYFSPNDTLDFLIFRKSDRLKVEKEMNIKVVLGDRKSFKGIMKRGGRKIFRTNKEIFPLITKNKDDNELLLDKIMDDNLKTKLSNDTTDIKIGYKNLVNAFSKESTEYGGFYKLDLVNYILNDPIKISAVSNKLTKDFSYKFVEENKIPNSKLLVLENVLKKARYYLDLEDNKKSLLPYFKQVTKLENFNNLNDHINQIIYQVKKSNSLLDKAFAMIDSADKQFMLDNSFQFIDFTLNGDKELAEVEEFKELIALTKKLDYKYFFQAALEIAKIYNKEYLYSLKKVVDNLEDKKIELPDFHHYQGKLKYFEENEDIGNIVIGGNDDNRYFTNVTVLIEPAGNDFYGNNCGASVYSHTKGNEIIEFNPTSIFIDFSGDDIYESSKLGTIGTGILGIGTLIDLAGNDSYNGDVMSVGSSFIGVGMLIDEKGNDEYHGQEYTEGCGFFGSGIILDFAGDDYYSATYFSQGLGGTKGLGIILDRLGNDSYFAYGKHNSSYATKGITYGISQGVGFGFRSFTSGGIGVLLDEKGDDTYYAGSMSQGIGYFFAYGVLNDRNGNDNYIGMRYAQGCGVHQAVGAFIDNGGDDNYEGRITYNQGGSWDVGATLFLDYSGDDIYKGANGQGVGAQNGFTLFRDYSGNDSYTSTSNGQGHSGGVRYSGGRGAPNIIFTIDSGGDDSYNREGRENNKIKLNGDWGVFLDYEGE